MIMITVLLLEAHRAFCVGALSPHALNRPLWPASGIKVIPVT